MNPASNAINEFDSLVVVKPEKHLKHPLELSTKVTQETDNFVQKYHRQNAAKTLAINQPTILANHG
jgi:hypothetical protein